MAVKAKVYTIGGFSAHADQNDLMEWVSHFKESGPRVFVVHGEPGSSEILANKIRDELNIETYIPKWKERLILKSREMQMEPPPVETTREDTSQALMNSIIDLEKELDLLKRRIKEKVEIITDDDIDRVKYIQEEIQTLL